MEAMANYKEVEECLKTAEFFGKPLQCFRGLRSEDYIFNDEEQLKDFLALSEERKVLASPSVTKYETVKNYLYNNLIMSWQLSDKFTSSYIDDYNLLNNKLVGSKTCHVDKYTTCLISPEFIMETSSLVTNIQPLPDFLRWVRTLELHYMPLIERQGLENGVWNDIPELFLPSTILELVYKTICILHLKI